MAKKFLTLNVGASTVELAEYEAGGGGSLTLVNYGTAALSAPLDGGDASAILSPALLEIVREKGIRPGKVAISVSGQMVFPRFASIAAAGGDDRFEQMVRMEIEQNIPFPIDEMVCDRQVLGDTASGEKSVLIVAAKIDQIESITSAVASAGFTPEMVDVAPFALVNVLRHSRPDEGCVVLLDVGAKTTSLVIAEGERIYNRSIPVAGNAITKEVAAALGCSTDDAERQKREIGYVSLGGVTEDEDETADRVSKVCRAVLTRLNAEISRSINFYRSQQGGSAPSKLYLTGGTALLPQIDQFFAESLGIEVEFLNPLEKVAVGSKVDAAALESDGAVIAATVGTALNYAGSASLGINLLPPALVAARAEKAKIPYLIIAGIALSAGLALTMLKFNHDTEVVSARRDAVQAKLSGLKGFDQKIKNADTRFAQVAADAETLRKLIASRSAAVLRVNAVRDSLLPGMWIDRWNDNGVTIRYWSDRIKDGNAESEQKVKEKLCAKSVVERDSVKIADMKAIGKGDQLRQFTLEVKFK